MVVRHHLLLRQQLRLSPPHHLQQCVIQSVAVFRIRIQGSSGSGFGIRIQGLKKKNFKSQQNNFNFKNNTGTSFNGLLLTGKSSEYEIVLHQFLAVLRMSLDPESDVWPDPDSMNPKHWSVIRTSVVDPDKDPNWIRLEQLCGSVIRIRIHIGREKGKRCKI